LPGKYTTLPEKYTTLLEKCKQNFALHKVLFFLLDQMYRRKIGFSLLK
jgi:hypothetical protein